jgi:hypothetical protein
MYRTIDIGVSLMSSSHPSYPPLEMMAFIQQLRDLSEGKPVDHKLVRAPSWVGFHPKRE